MLIITTFASFTSSDVKASPPKVSVAKAKYSPEGAASSPASLSLPLSAGTASPLPPQAANVNTIIRQNNNTNNLLMFWFP
jgi:hypothetical protein